MSYLGIHGGLVSYFSIHTGQASSFGGCMAQASYLDTARRLASFLAKKARFVTTSNLRSCHKALVSTSQEMSQFNLGTVTANHDPSSVF